MLFGLSENRDMSIIVVLWVQTASLSHVRVLLYEYALYFVFPLPFNLLVPSCGFPAALCSPSAAPLLINAHAPMVHSITVVNFNTFLEEGMLFWPRNLMHYIFLLYVVCIQVVSLYVWGL